MKEQILNKVEIIVAKEEIAHHEQFICLSQCFQKSSAAEAPESVCMWEGLNSICFVAGSKFGYHSFTYGLYLDKLVQEIDPAKRDIAKIFEEEIATKYGMLFPPHFLPHLKACSAYKFLKHCDIRGNCFLFNNYVPNPLQRSGGILLCTCQSVRG